MLKLYQICGRRFLRIMLYPVVFFIFIFATRARYCSYDYLKTVYQFKIEKGDFDMTKPNYFSVFHHIFLFANSLADRIESWSGRLTFNKLNFKTKEAANEAISFLQQKKGIFLISSHLGNIEALRAFTKIYSEQEIKVNALVQSDCTPDFNELMRKINPNFSTNLISANNVGIDDMIMIKDKLQQGEIVVAAGDRTASKNPDKVIETKFLNRIAKFPVGVFTLASLVESPIYFVFCLKAEGDKSYDFYLYRAQTDISSSAKRKANLPKIVGEYAMRLESICTRYQYQWYNFFDFWS